MINKVINLQFLFLLLLFLLTSCSEHQPGKYVEINIKKGMTGKKVGEFLKEKGVINNLILFKGFLKYYGDDKIKAGTYLLRKNMDEKDAVLTLLKGPNYVIKVTIPEGFTLKEIAHILFIKKVIASESLFIKLCYDKRILNKYKIPFFSLEGYLFPDTYIFYKESEEEEIIDRMVRRFLEIKNKINKGSKIKDEVAIVIASLIEKEAMKDNERPIIAGVFYNRLRRGMKLESCATIAYILPEHKDRLSYEDLKIDNSYNTYMYKGLPPGPICNSGYKSLKAAYYPERTEYLYFVSRGDGTHAFSKTSKEHLLNKKKYRR